MPRLCFLFLSLTFLSQPCFARYELNARLRAAYTEIIELRLENGRRLLQLEEQESPGNGLSVLYENYIDFLQAFITEEQVYFEKFKKLKSERIRKLEKDPSNVQSPFHQYAVAEMIMQEAMLKIKFREYISAAQDIRKAYKMVEKNKAVFPTFLLNKKLSGFLHTLVGAVPREYHWLVELAGMEGTVPQGREELRSLYLLLENSEWKMYRQEILFYLSNIHNSFFRNEDHAEDLLNWMRPYTERSTLMKYCYANVVMKMGRNDEALAMLTKPVINAGQAFPFPYLEYKTGLARLRKLDLRSNQNIDEFLRQSNGLNYQKSAYQKLAWIQYLAGRSASYEALMVQVRKVGAVNVDEDKEAENEAISGELPNRILLRSRLLFDGGYYSASLAEIAGQPIDSFPRYKDQLEVTYRLARIMHRMNNMEKAVRYYEQTIKNGSAVKFYFAANSALLLGNIYEENGDLERARSYYNLCLSFRGHEYQNSIDQKAQAGLDRLKVREKGR